MDANVIGRSFTNQVTGEKGEDGMWKVNVLVKERTTVDGEVWEDEEVSAMSIDTNFDAAHRTALGSVLHYLDDEVYSKGFDSLVPAMIAKRILDGTNDNKNSTS